MEGTLLEKGGFYFQRHLDVSKSSLKPQQSQCNLWNDRYLILAAREVCFLGLSVKNRLQEKVIYKYPTKLIGDVTSSSIQQVLRLRTPCFKANPQLQMEPIVAKLPPTLNTLSQGSEGLVLPTGLRNPEWDKAHQVVSLTDHGSKKYCFSFFVYWFLFL